MPFTGRMPGETHTECVQEPKGTLVRRKDDEPDAIRNRLRVYQEQTAPVIAWYRAQQAHVVSIDAVGSLDAVQGRALAALGRT